MPVYALTVLDRMDAYQKSDAFQKLGLIGRFIYATFLSEEVKRLLEARCPGCVDVPTSNHLCGDADPTLDPFILHLYVEAMRRVNLDSVKDVFYRAHEYLNLQKEGRNLQRDFELIMKRCFFRWFVSDFGTLEEDLNVEPDTLEAISRAFKDLSYDYL